MRGSRGVVGAITVLVAAAVISGCTTVSAGRGSAVSTAPGSTAPAPTTGPATSSSSPASSPPGGPSAVPPPAACPGGACPQNLSASLTSPYTLIVRTNADYHGGAGATIVELTNAGVPVFWTVRPGESPAQIDCESAPDRANCVLVDNAGAHGSTATVLRLAGGTLAVGSTVVAATPQLRATDLNGDGWVDVVGLQNTYQPDYATGTVYWQTWTSDGTHLTSTGCTTPSHNPPAAPTVPLHGQCP